MSKMATIKCAFCQGRGKDPFELLSELARCQVCNGKGIITVALPYDPCSACNGSGVKSHSRLVCTVCNGKGVISRQKGENCPTCEGSGIDKESDLPCSTCGGKGKV